VVDGSQPAGAAEAVSRPGFEVGFVDEDGERRREPLTSCVGVRFEEAAPVRPFRWSKGQKSFAGLRWSATTGAHVGYESWLERDHAMLLDFDPQVVGLAAQPFQLFWRDGRRERRHTPDYFARLADGTGVVVDVRPDDRIEPADAEAFAVTAQACARMGWLFRRVGVPDPVFTANVRWLAGYRHPRCGRPAVAERLVEAFAQPTALFDGAEAVGPPVVVLPVLYHLMWRQVLVADLAGAPLAPTSPVRRGPGGMR
jgi:hypothetical protein